VPWTTSERYWSAAGRRGATARVWRSGARPRWQDVSAAQDRRGAPAVARRELETVSRELGVTAATLTGWREAFLAAAEAALRTRPGSGEELASDRLKARLGAALIERDLLNEKIALLEADRLFARRRRKP
jgi:transposase